MIVAARREEQLKEVVDEIKAAGGEAALVVGDVSKVGGRAAQPLPLPVCCCLSQCFMAVGWTPNSEHGVFISFPPRS